ncbi:MAG: hypothetical protein AVDCRST_MAG70-632, partial [uncultured Thermomicrobiales bacterium]
DSTTRRHSSGPAPDADQRESRSPGGTKPLSEPSTDHLPTDTDLAHL